VQGQLDVPLNELGLRQAEAVARALAGARFAAIYSSDLGRARQTAEPAARRLAMPVVPERGLRERHYGIFETLTYAEVKAKFPEDYARFERRDPDFRFRSGESLAGFGERSRRVVGEIAARHPGEDVLVFTHGGVLDEIYRFVTGMPVAAHRDFAIPNAGLNRVEAAPRGWRIVSWADIAHLEGALDDLPG